jgi:hypothetical protein
MAYDGRCRLIRRTFITDSQPKASAWSEAQTPLTLIETAFLLGSLRPAPEATKRPALIAD